MYSLSKLGMFNLRQMKKRKKADWPKSAVIDDYFTFLYPSRPPDKRIILWPHSTVCTGYTSISRSEGKQEHAAFQGCCGQRFGCQDNKPLTKCPEVSDHSLHPLKQTSSTPSKPPPQRTFDLGIIFQLNLYQTQTHTQKQQNKILRLWQRWGCIGSYCVKIYIVSLSCNQPCCFVIFGSLFLLMRSFTTGSSPFIFLLTSIFCWMSRNFQLWVVIVIG